MISKGFNSSMVPTLISMAPPPHQHRREMPTTNANDCADNKGGGGGMGCGSGGDNRGGEFGVKELAEGHLASPRETSLL